MAGTVVKYTLEVQDKASAPVEGLAKSADKSNVAMRSLSSTVANNNAAMSSLRQTLRYMPQQFGDVAQSIAAGQPAWRALSMQATDVGFQLANAAAQVDYTAGAGARLAAASGPVAIAIAAIGTAAIVVANQISEARVEMERYAAVLRDTDVATRSLGASQSALRLASGDVAGFVGDLQIQTALLTGEVSKGDVAAGQLGNKLADTLRPRLLEAAKAVAQVETQIQSLDAAMKSGALNFAERMQADKQLAALRATRTELQGNLDAVKALSLTGSEAIQSYANALDTAAVKGEKAATATRKMADDAERMAQVAGAMQAFEFRVGRQGTMAGLRSEDLGATEQQAEAMWRTSLRNALESRDVVAGASAMWRSAAEAAAAEARSMEVLGGIGTGVGALTDPLGALGSAGPQGAAVAAILSTLESIGTEGTDAIVARLQTQGDAIIKGFTMLPELVNRIIEELPYSIGQSIAEALQNILTPDKGFFNPEKVFNRMTMGLFGLFKGAVGLPAVGEGFAVGDSRYVNRTGMALLHEGEKVVRSNGGSAAGPMSMGRGSASGSWGPPVIIQTAVVAPDVLGGLADAIGEGYDPSGWGRGTRPVFGG